MHLYLKDDNHQRTLILCTSPEDEAMGTPGRALVFRTMDNDISKVMVEFLPRKEFDFSTAVRLTTRKIKGCLGLINIGDGEPFAPSYSVCFAYAEEQKRSLRLCSHLWTSAICVPL